MLCQARPTCSKRNNPTSGRQALEDICPTQKNLYGIETLKFSKSDIQKLERLQLKICRQIQGLPDRTANAVTYALLGIETVEAAVDKLMLSFFGNIIQNGSSIEFRIIERQQVMSTKNKNAFASRIRNILEKYNLPTIITLMESVPPKEVWKRMVKNAVEFYWKQTWEQQKNIATDDRDVDYWKSEVITLFKYINQIKCMYNSYIQEHCQTYFIPTV